MLIMRESLSQQWGHGLNTLIPCFVCWVCTVLPLRPCVLRFVCVDLSGFHLIALLQYSCARAHVCKLALFMGVRWASKLAVSELTSAPISAGLLHTDPAPLPGKHPA